MSKKNDRQLWVLNGNVLSDVQHISNHFAPTICVGVVAKTLDGAMAAVVVCDNNQIIVVASFRESLVACRVLAKTMHNLNDGRWR